MLQTLSTIKITIKNEQQDAHGHCAYISGKVLLSVLLPLMYTNV